MPIEIPAARLQRLRELVSRHGVLSVQEARTTLDVSEMTVRRDFAALEELGLAKRTRGGIVAADRVVGDTPYVERQTKETEAKTAIGQRAAALVEGGDTIFLSGGTTCLALARSLAERQDITVVTNSAQALTVLMENPRLVVIATGGIADGGDMSGPMAESTLMRFRARKAFIGASGITGEGVFNSNLGRASADRLMVDGAAETCVLADHTKIGAMALVLVARLAEVRCLVTDLEPGPAEQEWLTVAGVRTVLASS